MMRARCLVIVAALCEEITTEDCNLGDRLFLLPSLTDWSQLERPLDPEWGLCDLIEALTWLRDQHYTEFYSMKLESGAEVSALCVLKEPDTSRTWPVRARRVDQATATG